MTTALLLVAGAAAVVAIFAAMALLAPDPLYREPSPKLIEEVVDGP